MDGWLIRFVRFLIDRLSLERERDDPVNTLEVIAREVEFRGVNLWVLICAVMVASVGLNVNSTAVIIGAMLISPLMGPIVGIGVGLATYDLKLFRKALLNFAVAVLFSIATSAFYFALTPLKEAQSELWARTSPTIWDVLIAFFGGLAGIIAATSREKKVTVIAGVAIATALMPPLCTAGYGLARGDMQFFGGALYLFFINAVFISTAAYLIAQVLRFPNHEESTVEKQRRLRRVVLAVVIGTAVPSIYLAWNAVQLSFRKQRLVEFIRREFAFPYTSVVSYDILHSAGRDVLRVVLVGEPLDSVQIARRRERLAFYKLGVQDLEVVQAAGFERTGTESGASVLGELYQRAERRMRMLEDSLQALHLHLMHLQQDKELSAQIARELAVLFPGVRRIALGELIVHEASPQQASDTLSVALVEVERRQRVLLRELERWLRLRTNREELRLVVLQ